MLCHECKEHIEVGEAMRTEYIVGAHRIYFHVGCHTLWYKRRTEEKQEAAEYYEELARLDRSTC